MFDISKILNNSQNDNTKRAQNEIYQPKKKKKKLTVSSAAPLMPRSWLKLEPAAAGDLFGASGLTA